MEYVGFLPWSLAAFQVSSVDRVKLCLWFMIQRYQVEINKAAHPAKPQIPKVLSDGVLVNEQFLALQVKPCEQHHTWREGGSLACFRVVRWGRGRAKHDLYSLNFSYVLEDISPRTSLCDIFI